MDSTSVDSLISKNEAPDGSTADNVRLKYGYCRSNTFPARFMIFLGLK
jgi:hypothetical protein